MHTRKLKYNELNHVNYFIFTYVITWLILKYNMVFNSNLSGLFRGSLWGGGGGVKLPPVLKSLELC